MTHGQCVAIGEAFRRRAVGTVRVARGPQVGGGARSSWEPGSGAAAAQAKRPLPRATSPSCDRPALLPRIRGRPETRSAGGRGASPGQAASRRAVQGRTWVASALLRSLPPLGSVSQDFISDSLLLVLMPRESRVGSFSNPTGLSARPPRP